MVQIDGERLAVPISSRLIYMVGVLEVLRCAGGVLTSTETFEHLEAAGWARAADISTIQASGESRFTKEVRFARLELVNAGLLEQDDPGRWRLSDLGWSTFLSIEGARELVGQRRHGSSKRSLHATKPGPTRGPRPTSFTSVISRSTEKISWVYVLSFAGCEMWKVGHAADIPARLTDVNRHLPVELNGQSWALFAWAKFPDAGLAYEMEQRLLETLSRFRTQGERVRCSRDQVVAAWRSCVEAGVYPPASAQATAGTDRP